MSADTWAVILIVGTAPGITLFSLIYGLTVKWWKSLLGLALFFSSTGLALLVDISLLYQWLGDDYALRDIVRLSVYGFIFVGGNLKCVAILWDKWRGRKSAQRAYTDHFSTGD